MIMVVPVQSPLSVVPPALDGAPDAEFNLDPWVLSWEADVGDIVTTLAIGEEAGPDPFECYLPMEPDTGWATTMALGEEGAPLDMDILLV
jgi:hypothetical protein